MDIEQIFTLATPIFRTLKFQNLKHWLGTVSDLCKEHNVKFNAVRAICAYGNYYKLFVIEALRQCDGEIVNFQCAYDMVVYRHELTLPAIDVGDIEYAAFYELNESEMWEYISKNFKHRSQEYIDNFKKTFVVHWLKLEYPCSDEIFDILYERTIADMNKWNNEYYLDETVYGLFDSNYQLYLKLKAVGIS
jgi:hypothetical protein